MPVKGVARSAGGCKTSQARALRCRLSMCQSERSEESNSSAGPGFYSTRSTPRVIPSEARNLIALPTLGPAPHALRPCVILSAAKNPGKEVSNAKGFFAALRMTHLEAAAENPGRVGFYIPRRFAPPPSKGDLGVPSCAVSPFSPMSTSSFGSFGSFRSFTSFQATGSTLSTPPSIPPGASPTPRYIPFVPLWSLSLCPLWQLSLPRITNNKSPSERIYGMLLLRSQWWRLLCARSAE
jgi:hypothetical protein